MIITCEHCGTEFPRVGRRPRRFCSTACATRAMQAEHGVEVAEPLKPRPCRCEQPIHVLEDDELRCLRCGRGRSAA